MIWRAALRARRGLQSKRRMFRFLLFPMLVAPALAGGLPLYDLDCQAPQGRAQVSLFGATSPYQAAAESDTSGRFHFRKLRAGTYTLAVNIPGRGEARQTVEVGPGTADGRRRVVLTLQLRDADFVFQDVVRRENSISASQLAVPAKAQSEYREAQKDLERHDAEAARKRLEHALELAPQFAPAWNELGTILYQTQQFPRAERCFREALQRDPSAYEPLVNLGGVLINNGKLDEALVYNQDAVLSRPNDALANSQLGMTYFAVNNFDLAVKYLEIACRLDPAHFSHPQLVLAEIHLRRGENRAAADALEDFLRRHPDYPQAENVRQNIARLRQ
jgi:Tfp pilus assembly protein PilF